MRVGVIGGTFDPIHIGHLIIAEEARVRLSLEKVVFVPAGLPPHKMENHVSPAEHRLEMVKLAIADNPYFSLSLVDVERFGPSFTVETIELLRQEWGPQAEIFFIMGQDSLVDILTWHKPQRLINLCRIVALSRPGFRVDMEELEKSLPGASSRIILLNSPEVAISSTDIQRRVREGLPIKYQVPEAVEEYIYKHGLYRD
ncbi:MAG: nicotinate-nucleotide adenylyltransferase [Anaerolineae bacterium]